MTRDPNVTPPVKLEGRVVALLTTSAKGRHGFVSTPVDRLALDFEGIVGNRHRGWTRKADARAPYLARGTPIRNERHLSLVAVDDLAEIARRLDLPALNPAWLGANVVVSGIPQFSWLPRGTRLFIGDAVLTVTEQNAPCTRAGEAISRFVEGREDVRLAFAKRAVGLRGVVAVVERPGVVAPGPMAVRVLAQWVWG